MFRIVGVPLRFFGELIRGVGWLDAALEGMKFMSNQDGPPTVFFGQVVGRILSRSNSVRESCARSSLRDALLPKVISGELRVRDAEAFLERAIA